jgi:hypothetical protein
MAEKALQLSLDMVTLSLWSYYYSIFFKNSRFFPLRHVVEFKVEWGENPLNPSLQRGT